MTQEEQVMSDSHLDVVEALFDAAVQAMNKFAHESSLVTRDQCYVLRLMMDLETLARHERWSMEEAFDHAL